MTWLLGIIGTKLGRYALIALATMVTVASMVAYVSRLVKAQEKLRVTQETLNDYKLQAKAQQEVAAMSDAAVTERLRKRWSR